MQRAFSLVVVAFVFLVTGATARAATHDPAAMDPPAPPPANTFVSDTFTGPAGTSLSGHVGENGATWTKNVAGSSSSSAFGLLTPAGRVRQSNARYRALYYASGEPASPDYTVGADVYVASALGRPGVVGRTSTTANTGYVWFYDAVAGAYVLERGVAGAQTQLCSYPAAAVVGSTHHIELEMNGTQLVGRVDGVDRCNVSDGAIADAGRAGLRLHILDIGMTDATGTHLDNFTAYETPASAPDVLYSGLRLDRTWSWNGDLWSFSDVAKAFTSPANFANAPLPDNAALDTSTIDIGTSTAPNPVPVNPSAANELQRQATAYGTYLNRATYTTPVTFVPADQPLVPVRCFYSGANCPSVQRQIALGIAPDGTDAHGGLPIPDDYVPSDPAVDSDGEALFYQPDYVSPCNSGWRGRFYEAWKLKPNPDYDPLLPVSPTNPKWQASSVGRVVDVEDSPGHYKSWTTSGCDYQRPGAPHSTYQTPSGMGVLASGLQIGNDQVSREDCRLGRIDHSVGLLVNNAKPGFRWPATRHDSNQPTRPLLYGMRLRLPPGLAKPPGLTRIASMLFDAAQRHGIVVGDKTNSSIGFRLEPMPNHSVAPECAALLDGKAGYNALNGFPWSQLQVLAIGSDANPTPTN